jgi:hypothetical protein
MSATQTSLSPVQEAEKALQVVGVLGRMQQRFAAGAWARGTRFGRDGGTCLVGAIDEATRWTLPGVAEAVTTELTQQLPAPFRRIARFRPRLALALYNDSIGGQRGAEALVRAAREELGVPRGPSATSTPARIWVAGDQVRARRGA